MPLDIMNYEYWFLWDVYGCVNLLREYRRVLGNCPLSKKDELCDEYDTSYPWDVFPDKDGLLEWADEIYSYLPCPSDDLAYDGDLATSDPIVGRRLSGKTTRSLDLSKKKKRDDKPRRKPRNSGRR